MPNLKIRAFEYVLFKLKEWYKEVNNISNDALFNRNNDLSILKVVKLNFFVAANEKELLDTFDKFYAMPLGHVESDVYDHIKCNSGELTEFVISPSKTIVKENFVDQLSEASYADLNAPVKALIDNSVSLLQEQNGDLINYPGFQLVELSHLWFSWKRTFSMAKSLSLNSRKIPSELIAKERKIFLMDAYN